MKAPATGIKVYPDERYHTDTNWVTFDYHNVYDSQKQANRYANKLRAMGYKAHAQGNGCLATNAPENVIKGLFVKQSFHGTIDELNQGIIRCAKCNELVSPRLPVCLCGYGEAT